MCMPVTCARKLCESQRYSEDVCACTVLHIASGSNSYENFVFCMLRAMTIVPQRLEIGPSACLEPLAQEDNSSWATAMGQEEPQWIQEGYKRLSRGCSLADTRQRGATLAGPCVHGATCVLACARTLFSIMFQNRFGNLGRNSRKRAR